LNLNEDDQSYYFGTLGYFFLLYSFLNKVSFTRISEDFN